MVSSKPYPSLRLFAAFKIPFNNVSAGLQSLGHIYESNLLEGFSEQILHCNTYIYTDKSSLKADMGDWGGGGKSGRTHRGTSKELTSEAPLMHL